MKPLHKLLIPIFIITLIVIVPVPVIASALLLVYNYLNLSAAFSAFEQYRVVSVVAVFAALAVYAIVKGHLGSHRAFYSLFGIVLILLTFIYNNPLSPLYSQVLVLLAVFSLDAGYVAVVRHERSRIVFLSLNAPVIVVLLAFPFYYLAFPGYVIFVCSFLVMGGTRGQSVTELNYKSINNAMNASPPVQAAAAQPVKQAKMTHGITVRPEKSKKASGRTAAPAQVDPPADDMVPPNVPWPGQSDYTRAMQNLGFSISAGYPDIRNSKVMPNPFVKQPGNVLYSSGNYGAVFKLENNGTMHALKCFTRSKPDLNRRYFAIDRTLKSLSGKDLAFVDFQYLPKAVRTFKNTTIYFPVLKMHWIEGKNLNTFITEQLGKKGNLKKLAETFIEEMVKIRNAGIAHGDIAGDNIVIDAAGRLLLVDYDGMYVPAFSGFKAQEYGHDNFQHPLRDSNSYSEKLDNFSILVTYLSLMAVAEDASLWDRYNKGDQDCLIFRKSDFLDPPNSKVIRELLSRKGAVRKLTDLLGDALKHDPLWDGCDPQKIATIQ
jgi:predicted Ser/Thr protein kinase